jgi:hypothetical protein
LFEPPPDAKKLAAIGLTEADLGPAADSFDCYPNTFDSIAVFEAMCTQWRAGFNGFFGLDYQALPVVLRMLAIPRADWRGIFGDVRFMEAEALKIMRENK